VAALQADRMGRLVRTCPSVRLNDLRDEKVSLRRIRALLNRVPPWKRGWVLPHHWTRKSPTFRFTPPGEIIAEGQVLTDFRDSRLPLFAERIFCEMLDNPRQRGLKSL
jgi:hypothetical protein